MVERMHSQGQISDEQASKLHQFAEDGFFRCKLSDVTPQLSHKVLEDVDRLWRERPVDLAYVFGQPQSMADSRQRRERMAPYRLLDAHSHSEALRALYLHPELFEWMRVVMMREEPVAFHSRFTEFGRSEPPARDALSVGMSPPRHLVSVWIALEDIGEDQGPPFVIPGSHKLPYYHFTPDRYLPADEDEGTRAHRHYVGAVRKAGLKEEIFELRRGEFLLFHPALLHGARRILKPDMTRYSFQVYFAGRSDLTAAASSYWKSVRGRLWRKEKRHFSRETSELIEQEGLCGFQNPLKGFRPKGLPLTAKIKSRLGS